MGWHDPRELAAQYVADVAEASHRLVRYRIVDWVEQDLFPPKMDGFRYDAATYLRCVRTAGGFHDPDTLDYHAVLKSVDAVERVNRGDIDEVWLFGFPYCGYYESIMVGPGAFWCNAPPLPDRLGRSTLPACARRFVVMGFSYERDVGCMLENLGHRAESIMAQVYAGRSGDANLWDRFSRYDKIAPGRASVGTVHFAPNSERDYDWSNPRPVSSDCDDWLRFPHLTGERRLVTCRDWGQRSDAGGSDMRRHHLWWLQYLPHAPGATAGILNNWWTYVIDPNMVEY